MNYTEYSFLLFCAALQFIKFGYRESRLLETALPCNYLRSRLLSVAASHRSCLHSGSVVRSSMRFLATSSRCNQKASNDGGQESLGDSSRADPLQFIRKKPEEVAAVPNTKPAESTGGQEKPPEEPGFWSKWFFGANAWKTGLISIGLFVIGGGTYFIITFGKHTSF